MVNMLLTYRTAVGWALSLIAATLTVVIFQISFGFSGIVSILVGVLAYVTAAVLWARFVNSVDPGGPPNRPE